MAEKNKDDMLETTPEIKQGHANIGRFNIGVYIVITAVCIIYFILNFKP